jgi:hypothetical protein
MFFVLQSGCFLLTPGGADVGLRSDGKAKPLFIAGAAGGQAMARRHGLREALLVDTARPVLTHDASVLP